MSRCFAYPPPGYAGKCESSEAEASLIILSSNELQREYEMAKTDENPLRIMEKKEKKEKKVKETKKERKERNEKKEKKEKEKKEKKVKEKSCDGQILKVKAVSEITVIHGKCDDHSRGFLRKCELELLDRSNLTEEHGRPCNSSESTENSAKRKRDLDPAASTQNHGKIFRIKLSSGKLEDPTTMPSRSVCPCSSLSSGEGTVTRQECKNVLNLPHDPQNPPPTATSIMPSHAWNLDKIVHPHAEFADHPAPKSAKVLPSLPEWIEGSTFGHTPLSRFHDLKMQKVEVNLRDIAHPSLLERIEVSSSIHPASRSDDKELLKVEADYKNPLQSLKGFPPLHERTDRAEPSFARSSSGLHDKKMDKKAAKYTHLLEMFPPFLGTVLTDSDDQGWLFPARGEGVDYPAKRLKVEENIVPSCCGYTLQPQAVYLADVGIYGLPYTVPF